MASFEASFMLRCCTAASAPPGSLTGANPDVAHVADVEHADAGPDRLVFGHQAAACGIFHRHIPAAEIHHARPNLRCSAFNGVFRSTSTWLSCDGFHSVFSGRK